MPVTSGAPSGANAAPTTFARLVVSVADLDRALDFYHRQLGLPATHLVGHAFLEAGPGVEVYLHQRPAEPSDLAVAGSFRVSHLDRRVRAWAAHGGVVVDEPVDQPWGERMAVVRDPDGHLVCLIAAEPVALPAH
jgi:catechol 2,3-dioxygenase-like lactoylglutathione lyase family enzyme